MSLLDSVLDQSLNEVESAPEYIAPPNGRYRLNVLKAEAKSVDTDSGEQVVAQIDYSVAETMELADANQEPVDVGSMFSESFFLNEKGMPYFKTYLSHVFADVDNFSIAEALSGLQGLTLEAVVKTRNSKGRDYTSTRDQVAIS